MTKSGITQVGEAYHLCIVCPLESQAAGIVPGWDGVGNEKSRAMQNYRCAPLPRPLGCLAVTREGGARGRSESQKKQKESPESPDWDIALANLREKRGRGVCCGFVPLPLA